ncbi:glycoside hydrolase family 1 protein [Oceanirhabdus seepicola]|uniref:Glycoside hydrolase family 1 protein n=1 Tax=Oceanirhabdus seepicola TaxID=2828781 RepID=A0A9J6P0E1_9CLOT|nr:glycoside hydrolase family 1 protein [Oceanirhabdus seepicola]MCM1989585.1 glycoside hydrolase family 1 protein [Oceanirhabdus seepicola]
MKGFSFSRDILLGSATASVQIEGGDKNNNWYRWSEKGKIANGESSIDGCDHWRLFKEDIELLKELKQETYRMSVEWARIEPVQGEFNKQAMARYREEIELLVEAGIIPVVTLHHFSEPIWFEDIGGWNNKKSPEIFEKFTEFVVENLKDLVEDWATINEPNVYLQGRSLEGNFPPGKTSTLEYFKGAGNLIKGHILAYKKIHEIIPKAKVGVVIHYAYFDTKDNKFGTRIAKKIVARNFHDIFIKGMFEGRLLFPLGLFVKGVELGNYCDYIGINYYSRHGVKTSGKIGMLFSQIYVFQNSMYNDLGWEIYPEGLSKGIEELYSQYKLPVWITENGTPDHKDEFRGKFIYDHLKEVNKLLEKGIPVERYYHWSTMDNFEWDLGYSPRFGLVEIDYNNMERKIRKSGEFYRDIIQKKGVTEDMIEKYLKVESAHESRR